VLGRAIGQLADQDVTETVGVKVISPNMKIVEKL